MFLAFTVEDEMVGLLMVEIQLPPCVLVTTKILSALVGKDEVVT
jgi:hypothetical protein